MSAVERNSSPDLLSYGDRASSASLKKEIQYEKIAFIMTACFTSLSVTFAAVAIISNIELYQNISSQISGGTAIVSVISFLYFLTIRYQHQVAQQRDQQAILIPDSLKEDLINPLLQRDEQIPLMPDKDDNLQKPEIISRESNRIIDDDDIRMTEDEYPRMIQNEHIRMIQNEHIRMIQNEHIRMIKNARNRVIQDGRISINSSVKGTNPVPPDPRIQTDPQEEEQISSMLDFADIEKANKDDTVCRKAEISDIERSNETSDSELRERQRSLSWNMGRELDNASLRGASEKNFQKNRIEIGRIGASQDNNMIDDDHISINSSVKRINQENVIGAITLLHIKLINQLSQESEKNESHVISAAGFFFLIGMLMTGLKEKNTQEKILEELKLKGDPKEFYKILSNLQKQFNQKKKGIKSINGIAARDIQGTEKSECYALSKEYFNCNLLNFDVDTVNKWIEDNVGIQNAFDKKEFENLNTTHLIMNLLKFDNGWLEEFSDSEPGVFTIPSGNGDFQVIENVKYIENEDKRIVLEYDDCTLIAQDYLKESDCTLVICLPNEGEDINLIEGNALSNFCQVRKDLEHRGRNRKVNLILPDVDLKTKFMFSKDEFQDCFSQKQELNLDALAVNTYADKSGQIAYIKWDKTGTKAGAASFGGAQAKGLAAPPLIYKCDRPFFVAIIENTSGTTLFQASFKSRKGLVTA